jgi:hypothetical protein
MADGCVRGTGRLAGSMQIATTKKRRKNICICGSRNEIHRRNQNNNELQLKLHLYWNTMHNLVEQNRPQEKLMEIERRRRSFT